MGAERAEFGLLGPLTVSREGTELQLGGPKQRALLAILLLEANHAVSADRLIDALWGDRPPEGAPPGARPPGRGPGSRGGAGAGARWRPAPFARGQPGAGARRRADD